MSLWSELVDELNLAELDTFGSSATYKRGAVSFPVGVIGGETPSPDETPSGNFTQVEIRQVDFAASPLPGGPASGDEVVTDIGDHYVVIRIDNMVALMGMYRLHLHAR